MYIVHKKLNKKFSQSVHMVCRSVEKGWSQARGVVGIEAVLNTQKRYQEQVTNAKYTETPQKVVLIQQLTETTFFSRPLTRFILRRFVKNRCGPEKIFIV
jgi:hypothetical protein